MFEYIVYKSLTPFREHVNAKVNAQWNENF